MQESKNSIDIPKVPPKRLAKFLFYVALYPLTVGAIAFSIFTRSWSDYSALRAIAFPVIALSLIGGLFLSRVSNVTGGPRLKLAVKYAFQFALLGLTYLLIIDSAIFSLKSLYAWALSPQTSFTIALVCCGVLFGGGFLFCFRLVFRSVYGFTEIVAGVVVALHHLASFSGDRSKFGADLLLALLTASIYLVVRGLDNIHQGIVKEPCDPAAQWIVKLIRKGASTANLPGDWKL